MKTDVKYSNFPKTRAAQKAMEKRVLSYIKTLNRRGEFYTPMLPSVAWWNALDRLRAKGLIRYFKPRNGFPYPRGYVSTVFGVRNRKPCRMARSA